MYQRSNQSMLITTNFHLHCCGEDGDWTAFVDEHQSDNLIDLTVFFSAPKGETCGRSTGHMLRCEHQRQGIQWYVRHQLWSYDAVLYG